MSSSDDNKHYFSLKGQKTEEALNSIAFKSFLRDWCYPNPKDSRGKEICDLLVIFDKTMIIWQIKDIEFKGNVKRYMKKALDDPIKQSFGAERRLLHLEQNLSLTDANGFVDKFNPNDIEEIFRIVFSVGNNEFSIAQVQETKGKFVHIIDGSIELILNELDTISDFVQYYRAKENLYKSGKDIIFEGGEENLLADYLYNNKSFDHLDKLDTMLYSDGLWEYTMARPEFIAKQKEDEISYAWDKLIEEFQKKKDKNYKLLTKELSRLNRLDRRVLSQAFLSAQLECGKTKSGLCRYAPYENATYVFLITSPQMTSEQKQKELACRCFAARRKFQQNQKVIGIAAEWHGSPHYSYEGVLLDIPEWTQDLDESTTKMEQELGYNKNLRIMKISDDEYPEQPDFDSPFTKMDKLASKFAKAKIKVGRNDPCPCGSGKKFKKCHGMNP